VYQLRLAGHDDASLLYRVYASTREEELAVVPWTDEQREAFLRMQFAAQDAHYRRHYEGAEFYVITVGGESAGRLYLYRMPREIRVMDIALLPDFRRRGIGERIFRDLFGEADASGQMLSIHVETNNPARRFYERLGFRAVDTGELAVAYVLMERYANTA